MRYCEHSKYFVVQLLIKLNTAVIYEILTREVLTNIIKTILIPRHITKGDNKMSLPRSLVMVQSLKLYTNQFTAKRFHTVFEGAVANKIINKSKATIPKEITNEAITLRKFPIVQSAQLRHKAPAQSVQPRSGQEEPINLHLISRQKHGTFSEFVSQNYQLMYVSCGIVLITLQYFIQKMTEDSSDLDHDRDYSQTSGFSSCNEYTIGMPSSHRLLHYEDVYSRLR